MPTIALVLLLLNRRQLQQLIQKKEPTSPTTYVKPSNNFKPSSPSTTKSIQITDIKLCSTTNPHAIFSSTELIINNNNPKENRFVYDLSK